MLVLNDLWRVVESILELTYQVKWFKILEWLDLDCRMNEKRMLSWNNHSLRRHEATVTLEMGVQSGTRFAVKRYKPRIKIKGDCVTSRN